MKMEECTDTAIFLLFFFFLLKTDKDNHRKPKTASTVQDKAGNNAKWQIQIPKMLLEPSRPEYKNTKHHLYVHETNKQFLLYSCFSRKK